jgi:cell division protein FtsL
VSTIPAVAYKDVLSYQSQPRYHQERQKHKKQLKVVKQKVVKQKKRTASNTAVQYSIPFPLFMLTVSAITAGMIVNVAQHALVSQSTYQVEAIKKEIQMEQQIQQKLIAQKARLDSPRRIETVAIQQLSMIKAPKTSYLKVASIKAAEVSGEQNSSASR